MVRIAAAQIPITKKHIDNLHKILSYISKAAKKKVDIVCFPETSLVHSTNKKILHGINFKSILGKVQEACKKNKIHCIFSTNLLSNTKIYNRAFLIDDKGNQLYSYDKANLWKSEKKKGVSKGTKNKVVSTKFGKIGIIICWDIAYPEYVQKLAKQGAWILFCPSYIINYKRELTSYEKIPLVRSFENSCFVVFNDAIAHNTVGYSYICSPQKILTQLRNKEGLLIADLDRRYISGLRKYYGLIKN